MKSAAATFLVFIACAKSMAQEPDSVTHPDTLMLDDVISQVVKNNDRAAAARFMEKAAYAEIGPAGAWDDPMLMVGVQNLPTSFNFSEDEMTMKMVGLSQNIPYAGQKGLQRNAARARAGAAHEESNQTILDLVAAARRAYYNLYYQRLSLGFITSQKNIQQDILSSATARLRSNQANQADDASAQADLWRIESDLLSTDQSVDAAENDLLVLMGSDPTEHLPQLVEPLFEVLNEPLEDWISRAELSYPPLKRLEYQGYNYRFLARAARRMRWPMLELEGSYGFREDPPPAAMGEGDPSGMSAGRDDMVNFQVNFSLPIFAGRQQRNMARSMDAMRQSFDSQYNQLRREVKSDLELLHSRAQRLSRSLMLYRERIVPADESAYKSAFAGYSANRVQFANLLMYAINIYRDKITANQIAYELASTLAEAQKYITNPDSLERRTPLPAPR
jgi:outer membrane protein TolC